MNIFAKMPIFRWWQAFVRSARNMNIWTGTSDFFFDFLLASSSAKLVLATKYNTFSKPPMIRVYTIKRIMLPLLATAKIFWTEAKFREKLVLTSWHHYQNRLNQIVMYQSPTFVLGYGHEIPYFKSSEMPHQHKYEFIIAKSSFNSSKKNNE